MGICYLSDMFMMVENQRRATEVTKILSQTVRSGYKMGRDEGFSGVTRAAGLADGAFTLLFVLVLLAVTALVGGEFIDAVPDDGAFNESIADIETHGGTAFTLFAVGLLIIPAAALIGYLWTSMGGVMVNGGRFR